MGYSTWIIVCIKTDTPGGIVVEIPFRQYCFGHYVPERSMSRGGQRSNIFWHVVFHIAALLHLNRKVPIDPELTPRSISIMPIRAQRKTYKYSVVELEDVELSFSPRALTEKCLPTK